MNERTKKLYGVACAGLLHDIGKLYQRADDPNGNEFLTLEARNIESTGCPVRSDQGGRRTHRHVLWTAAFWERHSADLPIAKGMALGPHEMDSAENVSTYHHSPTSGHEWQRLMQLADHCSAGMDRTKYDSNQDGSTEVNDPSQFRKARLQAPWIQQARVAKEYRLSWLSPEGDSPFPVERSENSERTAEYNTLAKELEKVVKAAGKGISDSLVELRYEALQSALEHATWCIPSSTMDVPDISLFDHSRGTAAISVALADYALDGNELHASKLDDSAFRFLIIDLAGIQDFIYDMNPSGFKGMAKVLRARSFFVSTMLEAVEIALLERLGLPRSQTLMNGGGKLVLLISARQEHELAIQEFRRSLDKALLETTHGRLRVLFGLGESFGREAMLQNGLQNAYESAFADLAIQKLRPFASCLEVSTLVGAEFVRDPCDACGKMQRKSEDKEVRYCYLCDRQRSLGEELARKQIVHFVRVKSGEIEEFPGTGLRLVLSDSPQYNESTRRMYQLWDPGVKSGAVPIKYIAHYLPKDDREVITFEELAKRSEKEGKGIEALGIVSADVDNLGQLFASVLKRQNGGLTTMLTLSRQLNFFFGGIIEAKLREGRKNIYTVYSGGDDMFFIGAWDEILEEAGEWSKMFHEFTCGQQHFSAGLSLAKPGVPVHRLREESEEQLHLAKHADEGKNRVSIWNRPVRWDEWKEVEKCVADLEQWRADDILNTGQAYRLLNYARRARKVHIENSLSIEDAMWLPHMRYDITRNLKDKDGAKELHDHLRNLTGEKREEFAKYYDIALTWAIYKTRQSGRKEEK